MRGIVLVLFLVASFAASAVVNAQTTISEPSAIKKAIVLNEPAVVLLYNTYTAIFSVPSAKYQIDNQGDFSFIPQGNVLTAPVQIAIFGSGFTITPDGYMITNAHVATSKGAKLQFLLDVVSSALQSQLQQQQFSADLSQNFENAYFDYLQSNGKFSNELSTVTAYLPLFAANGSLTATPLPGTVVVSGDIYGTGTEKDVAIIKVSADHPLPTVHLGDSDSLSVGDDIAIIGYPGIAASTQNIAGIESYTPTATAGIVSALKPMPEGWKVIQTDATVQHGNSGGPGLGANGDVIGIATFGGANPQSTGSELLSGINFLIPVNIAKEFVNQIPVTNMRGPLDQNWQKGLENFWAHHYSASVQYFNAVLSQYPGDPYATDYLQQANSEISKGNDVPISDNSTTNNNSATTLNWGLLVSASTLVLLAVVVATLTWFVVTRRSRRAPRRMRFAPQPRFCRTCGTAIHRPTRFCTKCGSPLSAMHPYRLRH